jgi:hypothetical protein
MMFAQSVVVATATVKFANATTPAPANVDVAGIANMPESTEATERLARELVRVRVPGLALAVAVAVAVAAAQKTRSHPDSALFRW